MNSDCDLLPSLKSSINHYIETRVEKFIQHMHWDSDSHPTVSQLNAFMAELESDWADPADEAKLLHWKSAAVLHTKALAKEMYLLGLRDGAELANRNIINELLEELRE